MSFGNETQDNLLSNQVTEQRVSGADVRSRDRPLNDRQASDGPKAAKGCSAAAKLLASQLLTTLPQSFLTRLATDSASRGMLSLGWSGGYMLAF